MFLRIKNSLLMLVIVLFANCAWANLPYYPIKFPRDEGGHFENVPYQGQFKQMTEWWYYNGTLTSRTGRKLGYYLSFNYIYFPNQNFKLPYIGIQVTDIDKQKVYAKRIFLFDKNSYSISTTELNISYKNIYSLLKNHNTYYLTGSIPSTEGVDLEFNLQFEKNPFYDALLVGGNGLVDMWNNTNTYYYSLTKLKTKGYFRIGNELFEIDPHHSLSWMDHQWGDFMVTPGQNQWIWTSVQLQNGMDINLGVILDKESKKPIQGTLSIVMPDNSRFITKDLTRFQYSAHINPGEKHHLTYDLTVPELNLKINLQALAPGQDLNGIWEGVSRAEGSYQGHPIIGQAYTENTVVYK
jgi:predicted secreted hydrolase